MKIARGALLARLNEAAVGLSTKETIEQSNSYVFSNGTLMTFNEEIMVRTKSPLDFDVVVNAADLTGILSKMPDEEIDISIVGGELVIKGKKKDAGIACTSEVLLQVDSVPKPSEWSRLAEGVMGTLKQAARNCSTDQNEYLATCVHVTPDRVEACDNFRLFRVDADTGFPSDILIPAKSVQELEGMELTKVGVGDGWVHFKTAGGSQISCRCSHEKYHKGIDSLLEMEAGHESITLPANLKEMVERAEVFDAGGNDARVGIEIGDGRLVITSRKDSGWYREKKSLPYEGRPLAFNIHPKFLSDILGRTRDVVVDSKRMKIVSDKIQFVVVLHAKAELPKKAKVGKMEQAERGNVSRREQKDADSKQRGEKPFEEEDIPF